MYNISKESRKRRKISCNDKKVKLKMLTGNLLLSYRIRTCNSVVLLADTA